MLDRKKELQLTSSTLNAGLLGPVIASYCKTVVDLVPAVENIIVSKITRDVCLCGGGDVTAYKLDGKELLQHTGPVGKECLLSLESVMGFDVQLYF